MKQPIGSNATPVTPATRRSGLSIAAGGLFLLAAVLPYVMSWDAVQWSALSALSALSLLASLLIAALLIMGRADKVLAIAIGLKLLLELAQGFISFAPSGELASLIYVLVLLLPQTRKKWAKAWALPFAVAVLMVCLGVFASGEDRDALTYASLSSCLDVWSYLFMGAWLAHPQMTFKTLFLRDNKNQETLGNYFGTLFLRGIVTFGPIIMVIGFIVLLVSDDGFSSPLNASLFLVILPCMGGLGKSFGKIVADFIKSIKATKELRHTINQINARSGIPGVSDRAKAEL
mgnify:CR=1 FL=1